MPSSEQSAPGVLAALTAARGSISVSVFIEAVTAPAGGLTGPAGQGIPSVTGEPCGFHHRVCWLMMAAGRTLRRVLGAVGLSALTTVCVSWGTAYWGNAAGHPAVSGFLKGPRGDLSFTLRRSAVKQTVGWYVWGGHAGEKMRLYEAPAWSLLGDPTAATAWYDAINEPATLRIYEAASGWPMPAMVARLRNESTYGSAGSELPYSVFSGWGIALAPGANYGEVRALPFRPLLPGFAANTAAALPVWLTVMVFAGQARRANRRRRGECPECGYSRAGLRADRACPECGK
jgi:hypothetical protein